MKKFYSEHSHKGWFAILFLLFFAPFGIYLTFKHKHFKNKTRYIVSAVALGWFSLIVISAQPTEEQIEAREAAEEEKEREKAAEEQKKKEDELAEEKAEQEAKDGWKDYQLDLLDHYADAGVVNIQANKEFSVFYTIVPNEFKLYTEEEKQYYVDETGTFLEEDINAHFDSSVVHVYFQYEDGNTMASRKVSGGWKVK